MGECGFLAANLYARSIFGEDALANVSIEKPIGSPPDAPVQGHIRIRAKTQVRGRRTCVCIGGGRREGMGGKEGKEGKEGEEGKRRGKEGEEGKRRGKEGEEGKRRGKEGEEGKRGGRREKRAREGGRRGKVERHCSERYSMRALLQHCHSSLVVRLLCDQ